MSDQSLWVAGLLTLVPLSANATDLTPSGNPAQEGGEPEDNIQSFQADELENVLTPAPIVSEVEMTPLEFSASPSFPSQASLDPDLYLPQVPQVAPLPQSYQPSSPFVTSRRSIPVFDPYPMVTMPEIPADNLPTPPVAYNPYPSSGELFPASESSDSVAPQLPPPHPSLAYVPSPSSSAYNPTPYFSVAPQSGSQLYQQRQLALKYGKLHSRLAPHSYQNKWLSAKRQPTHEDWKRLLKQEAQVMSRSQGSNRLNVLLGDSLTLWFPSEGLSKSKFWLNQGISGENTGHIRKRLAVLDQTRPDTIYLMAGINDLRHGKSDHEILFNLRKIVQKLRITHPQAEVVVQSLLPTRWSNLPNSRIQKLNGQIQQIAQQEGAHFLNLYHQFTDASGQLNQDYTTDGLHLSPQGYQAWQEALNHAEIWLSDYRLTHNRRA